MPLTTTPKSPAPLPLLGLIRQPCPALFMLTARSIRDVRGLAATTVLCPLLRIALTSRVVLLLVGVVAGVVSAFARVRVGDVAVLVVPQWLLVGDADDGEPGVALFGGFEEEDVDFFQGPVAGLGVEEEDDRDDDEVPVGRSVKMRDVRGFKPTYRTANVT